jgi:glyoxylase-like metal-dependent hydrolase (beta-lactamase superfamily II)
VLTQVADGVLVHESEFLQSHAVVVQGPAGVLVIDPGVVSSELAGIGRELRELGLPVTAGFSTHPHWDHLLWHEDLGPAPRYGTADCAARIGAELADPTAKTRVRQWIPPDIVDRVPLDLMGEITGLPAGTSVVPWDGPTVRIIEHRGHAAGHAALLIEERGVLVAGDMLSDVLIPMLDVNGGADPIGDYLAGLRLIEAAAGDAAVLVPGHGSVADAAGLRARLDADRAYVAAVRDGLTVDDPRIGPSSAHPWVAQVHAGQLARLGRA